MIHYAQIPDKDMAVVRGIPCTTALRTVIDLAPDVSPDHLREMVLDRLDRELFSIDEALDRIAEDDMQRYSGASLVRAMLDEL